MTTASTSPSNDSRKPALEDDRIIALIDYGVGQSVGFSESKLSKERARVLEYYNGERPAKAHGRDSGYMSLDVFEGVEDMKAQLLDTFAANHRPVEFDSVPNEPDDAARVRTDYITHVLFRQNAGYSLLHDTIDQGLMARNAIVKVWWDRKEKTEYVDLSKPSMDELQAYLAKHAEEKPEPTEVRLHEDGVTLESVRLRLTKDVSQARVKLLAGEEFGISPMAEDIATADMIFHRHEMTVSDLIKAGYDPAMVKELQSDDRLWMAMEPEKIARFHDTDDLIGTKVLEDGQEAHRTCMVYECYLELDLSDDGDGDAKAVSQLFKVTKVGTQILDKEPVDRKPFIVFCPLPRPNAFWGTNYAAKLIPTQTARTYLTRSIINHALVTNNPRLQVVKGGLMNPRELTENKFGGIVNVARPDAIIPLPQAGLNPFVFQTIQMLKDNKEEITSISGLAQGLNKDAISSQNSGDMVHELITVSQLRQKVVARNFAEKFLGPLYNELYLLVLENEDRQKIVQIAGAWTPIDFSQWPEEVTMSVSFALGYGEQEKEAAKWMAVHKSLEAFPALAGQYTPTQQYYVARMGLQAAGIIDVNSVLLPPGKASPPPPDPMKQADIAMKQADAAVKNANAQAAAANIQLEREKVQSQERVEQAKLALEGRKLDLESRKLDLDATNKQDLLAHRVAVDAVEMSLQKQALAQDKLTAEAQPTH